MSGLREALARAQARAQGIDRGLYGAALGLIACGFVLALASSPVAAARLQLDGAFALAWRHALAGVLAAVLLSMLSMLGPKGVRRVAAGLFLLVMPMLVLVLVAGPEVKGARRWLHFVGYSLQPSEWLKPALVVLVAWMLSEKARSPRFPGYLVSAMLAAPTLVLLLRQPDVGQTALLSVTLLVLLFLSGAPVAWAMAALLALAPLGAVAYAVFPHVRARVDGLFDPGEQVQRAQDAILSGGVLGRGPGEGVAKMRLPDAHADFIYAVAAEEFGILLSIGLPGVYAWIAARGLGAAQAAQDPFPRLAASGLISLFALQAAIHIAVNLNLAPAKGITLPFLSFGGSAMIGSAVTLGLALALLRRA